jgi:lambda family phage portal protein
MRVFDRARRVVANLGLRMYYAAAQLDRLSGHLPGPSMDQNPNRPIYQDAATIIARVRALKRDNPVIKNSLRSLVNNVLPTAILTEPDQRFRGRVASDRGPAGRRDNLATSFVRAMELDWERWTRGDCDFDGWPSNRKTWPQIQKQVARCVFSDGEAFLVFRNRSAGGDALSLQLEVIERDRLGSALHIGTGFDRRPGVIYDERNRITAYEFRRSLRADDLETETIDARDVIHVMMPDRPQMDTGDLALAVVLMSSSDLGEYIGNELEIKSLMSRIAGVFRGSLDGAPLLNKRGKNGAPFRLWNVDRGTVLHLPEGDFSEINSNRPGAQFEQFVKTCLHFIAVGVGLPYEVISGNFKDVSYSSGRMAWQQCQPMLIDYRQLLVEQMVDPVWRRFVQTAVLQRRLSVAGVLDIYQAKHRVPGYRYIDPEKESRAEERQIVNGTRSPQEICADHGRDLYEVMEQIAEAKSYAEDLGLTFSWMEPGARLKLDQEAAEAEKEEAAELAAAGAKRGFGEDNGY